MIQKYFAKALHGGSGVMVAYVFTMEEREHYDEPQTREGLCIDVWARQEGDLFTNLRALYEPDLLEVVARVFVTDGPGRDKVDSHFIDVRKMLHEVGDRLDELGVDQRPRGTSSAAVSSATPRPRRTSNPCASSASRPGGRRSSSSSSPTSA